MAAERLKSCDTIIALAEELGVHWRLLYKWRDQLEPVEDGEGEPLQKFAMLRCNYRDVVCGIGVRDCFRTCSQHQNGSFHVNVSFFTEKPPVSAG